MILNFSFVILNQSARLNMYICTFLYRFYCVDVNSFVKVCLGRFSHLQLLFVQTFMFISLLFFSDIVQQFTCFISTGYLVLKRGFLNVFF